MPDWIDINKDKKHMARQKAKAKDLRKSQWWKTKLVLGICHYCQHKFAAKELTMDHVVPLVRGGKSTKGNIVPCCKACNNTKKYFTPAEIELEKIKDQK